MRDHGLSLLWDEDGKSVEWKEPKNDVRRSRDDFGRDCEESVEGSKSDMNVSLLLVLREFGRFCGTSEVACCCHVPKTNLCRSL